MTGRWIRYVLILTMTYSTGWAQETKGSVWANLDVQFYGYIKTDASWSDSRINPGNYAAWVDSETGGTSTTVAGRNDDEFNITARETRLGMRLTAPEMNGVSASGRIEFDFYNNGGSVIQSDNKGLLLLRHAYLQLDGIADGWSLLAGQTSDVVSPLTPTTLNYTVLWWAGNIGYRRAQIRLTKRMDLDNDTTLQIQGAIARTMDSSTTTTVLASETGADAGFPTLQGRAAVTTPWWGHQPATLGISGHWGQEEHDYLAGSTRHEAEADTWSGALDVTLPVREGLRILGEMYTGENLSAYLGGIGHGVNSSTTAVQGIQNSGGWIAASMDPYDNWHFNTGYGRSENSSNDLTNGQRKTNSSIFTNAIYDFNQYASVGVEVSRWTTEYMGLADGKAWRGQISLILKN